jgi:hypothetical protein
MDEEKKRLINGRFLWPIITSQTLPPTHPCWKRHGLLPTPSPPLLLLLRNV